MISQQREQRVMQLRFKKAVGWKNAVGAWCRASVRAIILFRLYAIIYYVLPDFNKTSAAPDKPAWDAIWRCELIKRLLLNVY